jgi:hypothetical protein
LLAFVATFLTKELAVTLPAVMLLTSCLRHNTLALKHIIKTIILLLPFAAITLFYLLVRVYLWSADPDAVAVYTNFSVQHVAHNYLQWAFALVYPLDLYQAKNWLIENPVIFLTCAISLLGSVLLYIALPSWRPIVKSKALWIGTLWILITLIPMVGSGAHRWYLYLPSVGLSLIFAALYRNTDYKNRLLVVVAVFAGLCAAETWRESLDWRSQSTITHDFLQQVEQLRLYEHDELAFINVPFGYRGSFLFTHKSLYFAMRDKYGHAPTVHALTYLNLDTHTKVRVSPEPAQLTFDLEPNAHGYVMFSAYQRRFTASDSTTTSGYRVLVDSVNAHKQITGYRVTLPKDSDMPVYYFDGKHIIKHR